MAKTPADTSIDAAYRDDLAFIHDAGFGGFARKSAPWLLDWFRSRGIVNGRVIDLGCGSGIWAEALATAGYDVLGFDISAAMLGMSRRRVPSGEFHRASFLDAPLPPCVAVTALGEILNYQFDRRNTPTRLEKLFHRVYKALCLGGLFVFDVALPGRVPGGARQNYTHGDGWTCFHEAQEDHEKRILTRHITTFRRVGKLYRRDYEVHRLRLYDRAKLVAQLRAIGFRVRPVSGYGEMRFPPGYVGLLASRP